MTENSESKPKRSFNILGLLRMVAIILAVIVFLITAITNLLMVYIIFAPDDAPKPFYLMYYLPGQSPQVPVAVGSENQTATSKTPVAGENTVKTPEGASGESPVTSEIQPGQGILLDTGTKIVNLSDPSGRTFIRTGVVLEFAPNSQDYFNEEEIPVEGGGGEGAATAPKVTYKEAYLSTFKEEINTRLPVINDIIITLLSTKKFDQIYTSEGKEMLRQEIMQAVNSRLHGYKVIQVYFTEFVVQ